MMVVFMNETLFKVANGRFYYVEVVGKRIPNRCCLWLRRVGHISRACAYRVSGYTDSARPYWLRNIIFFSDILVLTFTYEACVCVCVWENINKRVYIQELDQLNKNVIVTWIPRRWWFVPRFHNKRKCTL